eukprot:Blabericola_migrator_1__160@NODE_1041_length_5625_cov_143_923893_g717_i0_p1_GENE_NODE_1041_length_5625_cov_143_923893_g717_i0NODE_1041_length_5625_cov_143_923893_g717_i0_p1_ORF_typecomplete_len672_score107_37Ku/PF02735_16/1_4e36Ku_N/PF03731_15/2_5e17Ku_C/PF03730_14/2_7e11SAP/PF02037_27/3_4e02SAP/PF02037_27/6_7e09_NODE_1041_length_5625_cov_143_923893_g717_i01662181
MDDFDPTAFESMLEGDAEGEGEENDEDNEASSGTKTIKQQPFKQAILICLDVHSISDLFPSNQDTDAITWQTLMDTLCQFLKSRIISNEFDKVGFVLYGTKQTKNDFKLDNIYDILAMDFLSSRAIGDVAGMAQITFPDFDKKYGFLNDRPAASKHHQATACPISTLFRYALRTFRLHAPVFKFTRKLLLFTHRSDPCQAVPKDRPVALQLGLDLVSNNVVLDILPLALGGPHFEVSKFYGSLLDQSTAQRLNNLFEEDVTAAGTKLIGQGASQQTQTSLSLLKDLRSELKRRVVRQRVLQKVHALIAPGVEIGLAIFIIVSEATKNRPVYVEAETNRPVYAVTTWIDNDTGELLAPEEMRRYYEFGDMRIHLSTEELVRIKTELVRPSYELLPDYKMPQDSRIMLLGFKPRSVLDRRRHAYKMQVYYGFPVDAEIDGSSTLFKALVNAMSELDRVAIFAWQYRNTSNFKVFAAIPHIVEEGDANGDGMFLLPIPFSDDIRQVHINKPGVSDIQLDELTRECVDKFTSVLEALDMGEDYDPGDVSNPALAHHYQALEALALGASTIQSLEDPTEPSAAHFESVKNDLTDLSRKFAVSSAAPKKRSVQSTRSPASNNTQVDLTQVRTLYESNRLTSLTVAQLQDILRNCGLKRTGAKAQLIDRLGAYLKSKP